MTHLPTTDLYFVDAPEDAHHVSKRMEGIIYATDEISGVVILDFDFDLLGTITPDDIDFDSSRLVDSFVVDVIHDLDSPYSYESIGFRDYQNKRGIFYNSDASFRSLLASHGIEVKGKMAVVRKISNK